MYAVCRLRGSSLLHSPVRRHAPCLGAQLLRRRGQSARAVRCADEDEAAPRLSAPPLPTPTASRAVRGLFAVEQVDGRARHLSWSESGGIAKEWKELGAADADSDSETAVSTRPSKGGRFTSWMRQMFLPTNYPHSVHKSYLSYHTLQFVECIVGTLVSVLCNQALLVSVGVSAEGSVFGAVAVQWIIKDGAGEVAKLFFIRHFASFFDSHPKTFNLLGAGSVLLGSGLQIASLVLPATATHFLLCAAGGNIFKLIGNAVWFTTHIKFVRCFAEQGNTGDVAAKSESQASVGQLLGYAAGIGLLTISHSAPFLYGIFAISVPAHMAITAWMLRVATFELLTLPRLSWLANEYVWKREIVNLHDLEKTRKTGLFGEFYKAKQDRYVTLTPQLEEAVQGHMPADRSRWDAFVHAFDDESYMLYWPPRDSTTSNIPISVFYHPSVTPDDQLRSVLHAACLRRILQSSPRQIPDPTALPSQNNDSAELAELYSALERSRQWMHRHFHEFRARLEDEGWRTDEIAFADRGRRVLWGSATRRLAP